LESEASYRVWRYVGRITAEAYEEGDNGNESGGEEGENRDLEGDEDEVEEEQLEPS
jgi:hypothetical protein